MVILHSSLLQRKKYAHCTRINSGISKIVSCYSTSNDDLTAGDNSAISNVYIVLPMSTAYIKNSPLLSVSLFMPIKQENKPWQYFITLTALTLTDLNIVYDTVPSKLSMNEQLDQYIYHIISKKDSLPVNNFFSAIKNKYFNSVAKNIIPLPYYKGIITKSYLKTLDYNSINHEQPL